MKERERFIRIDKNIAVNLRHVVKAERNAGQLTLYTVQGHSMGAFALNLLDPGSTREVAIVFGETVEPRE